MPDKNFVEGMLESVGLDYDNDHKKSKKRGRKGGRASGKKRK